MPPETVAPQVKALFTKPLSGETAQETESEGVTVRVFWQVAVPPSPVAVRVYVAVAEGVTEVEPSPATMPSPWSRDTELALAEVQESVEGSPARMDAGFASKVQVGAGCGETAAALVQDTVFD